MVLIEREGIRLSTYLRDSASSGCFPQWTSDEGGPSPQFVAVDEGGPLATTVSGISFDASLYSLQKPPICWESSLQGLLL